MAVSNRRGGIFIPENREVPHYVGHRKRLKNRFVMSGMELDSFQDYEAVEILLTFALARIDTKSLAKALIKTFGSFRGILEAPVEALKKIPGISDHTALIFKVVKASSDRYLRERLIASPNVIASPGDLINYCQSKMGWMKDEQFRLIYLNTRNQVIEEELLQEGTVDQTAVYPRKVMEKALQLKATALILVHNHPGGSPCPSPEDRELTRTLTQAARNLQIKVHDHLIIGREGHFSFLENNLL
jgi:DNA repair protein RadC